MMQGCILMLEPSRTLGVNSQNKCGRRGLRNLKGKARQRNLDGFLGCHNGDGKPCHNALKDDHRASLCWHG